MKKLVILLILVMLVASVGCKTAGNTTAANTRHLVNDTMRVFGFDQPSQLHPRELESSDMFEPYRGYP